MSPKIIVKKMDLETNIDFICRYVNPEFCKRNKTRPFAERTYQLYPDLRGKINDSMSDREIYEIVQPVVIRVYEEKLEEMNQKIRELQILFSKIEGPLMEQMTKLFQLDWPSQYENIICYVGCISSFPRNVMTKKFFISYEKDLDFLMMVSIHEINHFVLFEKWKQMHGYEKEEEPSYPEPLWFLLEMAVDPTLNTPIMQAAAPYPQKAYEQFYERFVDGMSAEDHIIKRYQQADSIEQFLDEAYGWIENHKDVLI